MMHITLLISKNTDEIKKVVLKLIFLLTYEQEEKNLTVGFIKVVIYLVKNN